MVQALVPEVCKGRAPYHRLKSAARTSSLFHWHTTTVFSFRKARYISRVIMELFSQRPFRGTANLCERAVLRPLRRNLIVDIHGLTLISKHELTDVPKRACTDTRAQITDTSAMSRRACTPAMSRNILCPHGNISACWRLFLSRGTGSRNALMPLRGPRLQMAPTGLRVWPQAGWR